MIFHIFGWPYETAAAKYKQELTKAPIDYFKMFYNDTAIYGNSPALMCAYAFCGVDHLVFGTDFPYDSQFGERYTRQTIQAIDKMEIGDSEKKKIFEDNASVAIETQKCSLSRAIQIN